MFFLKKIIEKIKLSKQFLKQFCVFDDVSFARMTYCFLVDTKAIFKLFGEIEIEWQ